MVSNGEGTLGCTVFPGCVFLLTHPNVNICRQLRRQFIWIMWVYIRVRCPLQNRPWLGECTSKVVRHHKSMGNDVLNDIKWIHKSPHSWLSLASLSPSRVFHLLRWQASGMKQQSTLTCMPDPGHATECFAHSVSALISFSSANCKNYARSHMSCIYSLQYTYIINTVYVQGM